jgi:hypothetical protein
MNRLIVLLVILCTVVPVIAAPKPSTSRAVAAYGNVPPMFEANQGQARKEVKFLARGNGYTLFLTSDGMQLALTRPVNDDPRAERSSAQAQLRQRIASTALLRMKLVGASGAAKLEALEPLPGTVNYLSVPTARNGSPRFRLTAAFCTKKFIPELMWSSTATPGKSSTILCSAPTPIPQKSNCNLQAHARSNWMRMGICFCLPRRARLQSQADNLPGNRRPAPRGGRALCPAREKPRHLLCGALRPFL